MRIIALVIVIATVLIVVQSHALRSLALQKQHSSPSYFILQFDDDESEWSIPIEPGMTFRMVVKPYTMMKITIPEPGSEWEEIPENSVKEGR